MADAAKVEVAAGVDPAALQQITNALANSITAGFERGFADLKGMLTALTAGPLKKLGEAMDSALNGNHSQGAGQTQRAVADLGATFSATAKDSLALVQAFKEIGAGLTATASAIDRERSALNRSSIEQNTELTRASNERVATLRNEGKLAAIEAQSSGQLQLREAKSSGQQRVQITREVLDTIGRLEKGLGTTLSGIAHTSVGAISKVFDTLKGVVTRADKETFTNNTFSTSLKERESEIQRSFERQTNTVRESVSRQESALISLRETTQKGVLGQVNNATLLGGLGAGFAAVAALKSTFTIGADFARGLAVLQASLNLTDADMKKVRQTSIDLGNDISLPGVSALDAAKAIQTLTLQFGSLGPAAVGAATAAAKGVLQLSRAAQSSGEDAAALIGSSVNVFKISASDAVFAADAITGALTHAAGVGFAEFKDSFIQGATVFEQFVGPAESAKNTILDFNTTLAILAKNGITGANAGAGLKQFFLQATKDTKAANTASAELTKRAGETGKVFFDSSGKARTFADSIEILRKGVVGLSDQARRDVLGTLFGSRSITVANALINSTGISFKELRDQIAQQGIAAKIAAAQNTGLKGALDALKSVAETVQILIFEKVNKPLGAAVLAITNFANTILFSASPAMHTLRIALEGVGAGLAALLALKTATEVLGLLGKTAALVFTPLGGLVALFALVGAGIALFADKTGGIGANLTKAKDAIVGFGESLLQRVQPVIQTVSNFIQQTAIPTVLRWAGIVGRDLKGAFEATVSFVKDTVIPGFQSFIGVLESEVFPKIASVAEIVGNAVVLAKDKVVGFATAVANVVGPLIQPAIKGFQDLGTAIAGFFSGGGLSQLGSGFASAGAGIGSAFANIGVTIFDALKPLAGQVFSFFQDVFSVAHLTKAVNGIGDFLNFIGQKLGEIVSNPKVLAAVGIVAGVAAKLAFDLVSGIVEGIASNIPHLLADAWQLAVKFAFKPEVLLAAIVGGLALLSGSKILATFRSLGEGGASGFTAGFKSKLSTTGDFLSGLFGGANSAQAGAQKQFFADFAHDVDAAQNKARALGSTKLYEVSAAGLQEAKADIENYSRGLSDAQIKGLEFRDRVKTIGTATAGVFAGGGEITKGLAQIPLAFGKAGLDAARSLGSSLKQGAQNLATLAFGDPTTIGASGEKAGSTLGQRLRDGLTSAKGSISAGFSQITTSIQEAAEKTGKTSGQLIGSAIKGAALAAIAVGGGIAAGQALGQAQGTGDKLQAIGGLAAASLAIGAINPIAGIATAGIGLLTAAFTDDGAAARQTQVDVKAFADSLQRDLDAGTTAATKGVIALRDAINGTDLSVAIGKKLTDVDNGKLITQLNQIGVSFADVDAAFKAGGPGLDALSTRIHNSNLNWVEQGVVVKELTGVYGEVASAVDQVNASNKFLTSGQKDISTASRSIVQGQQAVTAAIIDSGDALDKAGVNAQNFGVLVTGAVPVSARTALADVSTLLGTISSKFKSGVVPAGTVSGSTPADEVAAVLQHIVDVKAQINDAFSEGILPPGVSTSQDALDQAVLAVSGVGEAIKKSLADNVSGGISDAVKNAQIDQQLKTVSDQAAAVIKQGVNEGIIIDDATATAAIAPLKKEILDSLGADNPEVTAQIEATFGNIVAHVSSAVDDAQTASTAQNIATVAQNILNGTPISVASVAGAFDAPDGWAVAAQATLAAQNLTVTPTLLTPALPPELDGKLNALLADHKLEVPAPVVPDIVVPAGFDTNAISAAKSGGVSVGSAVAQGIKDGMNSGSLGVAAAAKALADRAAAAARAALVIASPSKVFHTIGIFITRGLSEGIDAGGTDVTSSITSLVAKAIDAATGAVNDASKALRSGGSDLFSALFGSGSAVGKSSFGNIQGSITSSFNSLGSTLDDSFNKAADILKRSATEALSRSELDLLGEKGNSLNVNDVIGSTNRAALASTLDEIVGLGKAMIETGTPASEVTQTLQGYIDHTRDLAAQYGLNVDEVNALIDQLGLGSTSLAGFVALTASLSDALGNTTSSAKALNDTAVELFKSLTDGADAFKSLQGVGLAEDARSKVTSGLATIAAAADAADQRAKGILDALNAGTALSFADQLALNQGLNGRQINTTDQFGIANRSAFEDAIGGIRDLAKALIAGGSSIDYVNGQINDQVAALEAYGASLGFNTDQIQQLVDQAGLGGASLAAFTQSVADAKKVSDKAAAAQNAVTQNSLSGLPAPGALPAAGNTFTPPPVDTVVRDVIVNQYLPYADPAAISLAAANGVASAVRLPV